jgi:type I restriction enzyme M protein
MSTDTRKLQKAFADISNHIYVNDGVLKDRVFVDVVRLIGTKMLMEKDPNEKLLNLEYLNRLEVLEYDSWAKALMNYAIKAGIEESLKATWNIKDSSLHWASKELSIFDFNAFPADVKGEAFQALVVNNLRGDRGEYFTPEPLVSTLCGITDLSCNTRVIDPACGSGGFLYGAYRAGVNSDGLFGSELSNDVGGAAQTRVQILGGSRNQVRIGDAFKTLSDLFGTFDRVLMNPPFGSRAKIEDIEVLSDFELSSIKRRVDNKPSPLAPEILFLELAIKLMVPGGIVGTVIPDGVLQNSSSKFVRDWLLSKADLMSVISCPTVTFVPYGTGVKTSLVTMQKKSKKLRAGITYMGISNSVGYDPRGKTKYLNVLEKGPESSEALLTFKIDEDLTKISSEINELAAQEKDFKPSYGSTTTITINSSRWDAEFYQKNDSDLLAEMNQSNSPMLSAVCDLANQKIQKKHLAGDQQYVAIADVDSRTSQIVNIQSLELNELPSRASYIARKGDVITALAGASTGTSKHASAIIKGEHDGIIVSSGFALLRPTIINSYQLLGFLRSEFFLRQVFRLRTGHAIPAVAHAELMDIRVPPLENPIWNVWATNIKELDSKAENLFKFADSIRIDSQGVEGN